MLLKQGNNHVFIAGITRSGKTYFAINAAAEVKGPVLFFNIQEEDCPVPFLKVDADKIEICQLLDELSKNRKIDLRFGNATDLQISALISYLIKQLMNEGYTEQNPIYLIIDECHLLSGVSLDAAISAATRGLKRGIRCIFVTQRPALANKTLYTQSAEQYIFHCSAAEKEYLKSKGIDFDYALAEWQRLGKYSYIYTDGFVTEGKAPL